MQWLNVAGNQPKCVLFVRLTPLRLERALTLMVFFENVLFYGNGNGDYLSRSRKSVIQTGIQN